MLSPDERRKLHEIERWFEQDDPRFAAAVKHPPPDRLTRHRRRLAIAAATLGATLFTGGLLLANPAVIFIGITLGVGSLAIRYLLLNTPT